MLGAAAPTVSAPIAPFAADAREHQGDMLLVPHAGAGPAAGEPALALVEPQAQVSLTVPAEALAALAGAPGTVCDAPMVAGGMLLATDGAQISAQADTSLIHLDQFRSDLRFAGIDGSGVSVVVIDTGIDLNHSFFGPDANNNGIADRIVFQYDFSGSNDANASDTNGHGSNVASIIGSQDATHTGMAPGRHIIALKGFPPGNGAPPTSD